MLPPHGPFIFPHYTHWAAAAYPQIDRAQYVTDWKVLLIPSIPIDQSSDKRTQVLTCNTTRREHNMEALVPVGQVSGGEPGRLAGHGTVLYTVRGPYLSGLCGPSGKRTATIDKLDDTSKGMDGICFTCRLPCLPSCCAKVAQCPCVC